MRTLSHSSFHPLHPLSKAVTPIFFPFAIVSGKRIVGQYHLWRPVKKLSVSMFYKYYIPALNLVAKNSNHSSGLAGSALLCFSWHLLCSFTRVSIPVWDSLSLGSITGQVGPGCQLGAQLELGSRGLCSSSLWRGGWAPKQVSEENQYGTCVVFWHLTSEVLHNVTSLIATLCFDRRSCHSQMRGRACGVNEIVAVICRKYNPS